MFFAIYNTRVALTGSRMSDYEGYDEVEAGQKTTEML